MSLDASSVTCQCANRFCLVEESTQSRDDFLECMRTAPDRPGIVPFFQGEDELFETGWMCNLFYLYGSELTYRHLCASLLSAPSAVGLVGPVGWSGSCVFMHNLAPMSAESIWEFVGCRMRLESVGWPRTLGHDVTQNLADSGELCNKTCMTFVQIYETCLEIASFSHCSYCSPSFYCLWYFERARTRFKVSQ